MKGKRREKSLPDCRLERTPSQANADVILADDWRRDRSALLVSVGVLPGVPDHQRN
jgi:hypothetical protein